VFSSPFFFKTQRKKKNLTLEKTASEKVSVTLQSAAL